MTKEHPVSIESEDHSEKVFKPGPLKMFVASVIIIFVAEALVMLLIGFLGLPNAITLGLIDATLLSLIVVPTLYFLLFKPMRATIIQLDQSEKAQSHLEEIDCLKSDFISIVAHELCAPVSTISGYADLLLAGVSPEQQKKYLEVILNRTESLNRIIDDLQVVNHLDSGENLQINKQEHDLVATVKHVKNVYDIRLPDKPIHFELPEAPLLMQYDDVRINQVLDNLLSNAIKYENDLHDRIDLRVTDCGDHAEIMIRDEGIGMTSDELMQVYNKFFRAHTEKALVGGLGLGMAIVKNIIDGHGGTIDIVSQRKVGTTVTVKLPKK